MAFNKYFTKQEEKALLTTVKSVNHLLAKRDYAWMVVLRCTGLRIEAFSLLNVSHALEVINNERLVIEGRYQKRKIKHDGYVNKRGQAAFKRLLQIRKKMGYTQELDAPLVMSRNHKRLSVRSYQARMMKWVRAAGLQGGSPHWWRHTLAKRLVQNSSDPNPLVIVQNALDHTSTRHTGIYTQPDKEDMRQAMEEAG